MKRKQPKRGRSTTAVLRLPDLEHAKSEANLRTDLPRGGWRVGADSVSLGTRLGQTHRSKPIDPNPSIQTRERYLGCTQRIASAVNARNGIDLMF